MQDEKEFLHKLMILKINSSAQHCWKDHRDSHCRTDLKNDWEAWYAVNTSNKCMLKSVHRDNSESAD